MSPLILKHAPIGLDLEDYDVLEDGVVVGRIFLSPAAPQDRPWMWASGHNGDFRRTAHGYEPTREQAMAAFAKSWRLTCGVGGLAELIFAPICCNAGADFRRAAVRPNSKVILPYEPGYTGHWEMEKRRKETRDWLRKREQQVNRINTPSIVPESEPNAVTEPEKNDHH